MKISTNVKVSGEYQFEIIGEDGVKRPALEKPSSNLILDYWIDWLNAGGSSGMEDVMYRIHVGTGTTPPEGTDAGLENSIGSVVNTGYVSGSRSRSADRSTVDWTYTKVFTFGLGAISGNLTEIGCSDEDGYFISRALIKDDLGNPTTITVLPSEQLVVTYRIIVKGLPLLVRGTLDVVDKDGNLVDTVTYAAGKFSASSTTNEFYGTDDAFPWCLLTRHDFGKIDAEPDWTTVIESNSHPSMTDDTAGFSATQITPVGTVGFSKRWQYALDEANVTGGFNCFAGSDGQSASNNNGWFFWFDKPIPKTDQELMEIELNTTYSRI